MAYPPWVVIHVPHGSSYIPNAVRGQFLISGQELSTELIRMTDHHTLALFSDPASTATIVRAPVSRLVVDVERFEDDEHEPMAARGMGAIYSVTSDLKPLRRSLAPDERDGLMQAYYRPHHARLEAAVAAAIEHYGRCLVVDCHSFPSVALPYEHAPPMIARPDICIGTDAFHTDEKLTSAFVTTFQHAGSRVSLNDPFAGALVPNSRYRRDRRVSAVMVEINRRLYVNETDATPLPDFADVAQRIRGCCMMAISACEVTCIRQKIL